MLLMNNGGYMTNRILKAVKNVLVLFAFSVTAMLVFTATGRAAEPINGAIAQSYRADDSKGKIVAGALVSSKANDSLSIELATNDPSSSLLGVAGKSPLVVLSTGKQQIQVVISGTARVLVSSINGTIRAGDKIAPSPINGVGMRATTESQIVGTAQTDFDTKNAYKRDIIDRKGRRHSVLVGYISLQVGTAFYRAPANEFLPPFIQDVANTVAGRQVSAIRVLLAAAIALVSFATASALIYGAVRTAMTSLGRNPLAAHAIRKSLYQIVAIALAVLGGALAACYVILSV